jgi:uncharacterized membrane protein
MIELPPIPTWDGLHPLIVHFPVALLLLAPVFVIIGLAARRRGMPYLLSALLLMAIGTVAAYVAVESGEAAARLAERSPQVNPVLEHHEELAERTRLIFTLLTAVFAGLLLVRRLAGDRLGRVPFTGIVVLFLVIYGGGMVNLANTAHNGGRLVHEFGLRSLMPPNVTASPATTHQEVD